MKIMLIGDPPAADKTARKLESVGVDLEYVRNAAESVTAVPRGTDYVLAMNAGRAGVRIKEYARQTGAKYVPIPPSWSATLNIMEAEGITDRIIGELLAGKMSAGLSVKEALEALQREHKVRMAVLPAEAVSAALRASQTPRTEPVEPTPEPKEPAVLQIAPPVETHTGTDTAPTPDPTLTPAPTPFEIGREKLHDKMRAEREKSRKMIVEFIKLRNGDVSSEEIGKLMRDFGMPFNGHDYLPAREAAGVPLRKPIVQVTSPRKRMAELMRDWEELLATTPDADKPTVARKPKPHSDPLPLLPSPRDHSHPTGATGLDLRDIPTEDLVEELERRKAEARRLLALLGE